MLPVVECWPHHLEWGGVPLQFNWISRPTSFLLHHWCLSSGRHNKIPQTGWLKWQTLIFSPFCRFKSKIRCQHSQFLWWGLFLACRWLLFCFVLTWPLCACRQRKGLEPVNFLKRFHFLERREGRERETSMHVQHTYWPPLVCPQLGSGS